MTIKGVEALQEFTGFIEVKSAVGQYAIDVEERDSHRLRSQQKFRREIQSRTQGGMGGVVHGGFR